MYPYVAFNGTDEVNKIDGPPAVKLAKATRKPQSADQPVDQTESKHITRHPRQFIVPVH